MGLQVRGYVPALQQQSMIKVITILIVSACYACTQTKQAKLPYFDTPDFTPLWLTASDSLYKNLHTIPFFSFTDQHGKTITKANVQGKIYVADFFFTKCTGICAKMTNNMGKVATAFANDNNLMILSHSVTPEDDTPGVLKKYAQAKHITKGNWHLLTGSKQNIYNIARKGYYADEGLGLGKDTTEFLHTENFVLVDRHGRIRGVYNGTIELEVDRLIKHITLLKKEQ